MSSYFPFSLLGVLVVWTKVPNGRELRDLGNMKKKYMSCQLAGPTIEYTAPNSNIKQSHPLTQAIRHMNKKKWIRLLELAEIRGMEPYQTAIKAAGLGEGEAQVYVQASKIANVLYEEADHDAVGLEVVARMKEIKPDLKCFH